MDKEYEKIKGRIFNIQKYSIHDGKGIRTIVFLKGCYLRCKWCCNPESQNFEIQTMYINGIKNEIGRDITVKEVLDIVEQDRAFYRRSGGGMTLSGGECLFQEEFTKGLCQGASEKGINVAIETTGAKEFSVIQQILPYVNTVLLDIKHMDSEKHKKYTGINNKQILENAQKISLYASELIVRIPIIPGFNDTKKEIYEIASFASKLKGVKEIHLLPYHNFGEDKYFGLNLEYQMQGIITPSQQTMEELLTVVNSVGLKGQIGG